MESAHISSTQHGAHAAHGARAARSGGKATAPNDLSGAQAPQGAFAALLAVLGGDGGLLPQDGALPQADDEERPGTAGLGGAATAGALPGQAAPLAGDALASAMAHVPAGSALVPGGTGSALVLPGTLAPDSLVAQTAWIDKAAEAAPGRTGGSTGPAVAGSPAKGHAARPYGWSTAAPGESSAGAAATQAQAGVPEKKSTAELLMAAAQASAAAVATGAERRDGGAARGELHARASGEAAALAAPGLQALSGVFAEALAESRQAARGGEPATPAAQLHGTTATGEPAADPTRAVPDGTGVSTDPSQMGADDQLAQQVAFWVNQKTQNAELTLDRDGQPVEVRVSLSGNEAHVTFRSDQVQTRDALDASTAQLRDLLQREGLVLAGVTVGSSGGGDSGAGRESSGRQGAQQGRVQVAVQSVGATPARGAAAGAAAGNRAVDIFV